MSLHGKNFSQVLQSLTDLRDGHLAEVASETAAARSWLRDAARDAKRKFVP